jgi:hypothetical protein
MTYNSGNSRILNSEFSRIPKFLGILELIPNWFQDEFLEFRIQSQNYENARIMRILEFRYSKNSRIPRC